MPVLTNIRSLARCEESGAASEIHQIADAALVWQGEQIVWLGVCADLPEIYAGEPKVDANKALVAPGLIDCHTHLAFGGWREDEFEQRCLGASYQEIAAKGGGILSSVKTTRTATEEELIQRCAGFLKDIARLGVTTIEAKSGYGLNVEDELKVLRVYKRLNETQVVDIIPTYLGAHVIAPEYREDRSAYLKLITDEVLPQVAEQGLAEFCDVFVEEGAGAYSIEEARTVLLAAKEHGLQAKLHVDQLSDGGGAQLAAELGAVSADHLEYVSDAGISAMAKSGVIAVSLPLASLYLRQPALNARKLIDAGVRVSLATDFNPGSAPSYHLPMAMTLACTLNRLTPHEAIKATTIHAAMAINRQSTLR